MHCARLCALESVTHRVKHHQCKLIQRPPLLQGTCRVALSFYGAAQHWGCGTRYVFSSVPILLSRAAAK